MDLIGDDFQLCKLISFVILFVLSIVAVERRKAYMVVLLCDAVLRNRFQIFSFDLKFPNLLFDEQCIPTVSSFFDDIPSSASKKIL